MIWFDTDAEYQDYLKSKNGCGLGIWGWITVVLFIIIIVTVSKCTGDGEPDRADTIKKESVNTNSKRITSREKEQLKEVNDASEDSIRPENIFNEQDSTTLPVVITVNPIEGDAEDDLYDKELSNELMEKGYNPYATE